MSSGDILTKRDVAELLQVSERTVERWMAEGGDGPRGLRREREFGGDGMARLSEMSSNRTVGKRLLDAREAALYLGLEVDTVYKKARLRGLPSVKVGRALRFDIRALDRLIEQNAKPIA
ncbi:MAG: helix-turn-helix domain-containing protein [Bryobacteraceae bacterium]|jgi:excisionase family DNA binding protein